MHYDRESLLQLGGHVSAAAPFTGGIPRSRMRFLPPSLAWSLQLLAAQHNYTTSPLSHQSHHMRIHITAVGTQNPSAPRERSRGAG
jgi:hypothetical protein